MSLQSITKENNYTLYCKNMICDTCEINDVEIENITVNNATVLTQVTTPHINSGTTTFNTVGTVNIDAVNGNFENLNVLNTTQTTNLAVSEIASFNNVGINGTLTASSFNTTTLQTQDLNVTSVGVISNLVVTGISSVSDLNVSGTLTTASFNPTNIVCDQLTVNDSANIDTANINTLNLSNNLIVPGDLSSNTGTINTLSGSEFNYDIGYAADLSCKNFRIFSELTECPVGRIDDLTSDIFTNITSMSSPSITMGTVASIQSTPLTYHYYTNTTTQVAGAISPINVTLLGFRIGNYISLQVSASPTQVCTNNAQPLDITIPFPFRPTGTVRGTCLIRKGPLINLARWAASGGLLSVYAGLTSSEFWTLGEVCSLDTGTWNFSWVTNGA